MSRLFVKDKDSYFTESKPYKLTKLSEYLYDIEYFEFPFHDEVVSLYEEPEVPEVPEPFGCSTFYYDGRMYRNFDFSYNEDKTFIIHLPNGVEGIAYGSLDDIDIMPYRIVDGMVKDKGIGVSVHLVPTERVISPTPQTYRPRKYSAEQITYTFLDFLSRHTLEEVIFGVDYGNNLEDLSFALTHRLIAMGYSYMVNIFCVNYPLDEESVRAKSTDLVNYETLLSDYSKTHTMNITVTEGGKTFSAKYPLNFDTPNLYYKYANFIPNKSSTGDPLTGVEYPMGKERFALMPCNLKELAYTQAYTGNFLSEFFSPKAADRLGVSTPDYESKLTERQANALAVYNNRVRDGKTWHTMHSVVYNLIDGVFEHLWVQEDFNKDYFGHEIVDNDRWTLLPSDETYDRIRVEGTTLHARTRKVSAPMGEPSSPLVLLNNIHPSHTKLLSERMVRTGEPNYTTSIISLTIGSDTLTNIFPMEQNLLDPGRGESGILIKLFVPPSGTIIDHEVHGIQRFSLPLNSIYKDTKFVAPAPTPPKPAFPLEGHRNQDEPLCFYLSGDFEGEVATSDFTIDIVSPAYKRKLVQTWVNMSTEPEFSIRSMSNWSWSPVGDQVILRVGYKTYIRAIADMTADKVQFARLYEDIGLRHGIEYTQTSVQPLSDNTLTVPSSITKGIFSPKCISQFEGEEQTACVVAEGNMLSLLHPTLYNDINFEVPPLAFAFAFFSCSWLLEPPDIFSNNLDEYAMYQAFAMCACLKRAPYIPDGNHKKGALCELLSTCGGIGVVGIPKGTDLNTVIDETWGEVKAGHMFDTGDATTLNRYASAIYGTKLDNNGTVYNIQENFSYYWVAGGSIPLSPRSDGAFIAKCYHNPPHTTGGFTPRQVPYAIHEGGPISSLYYLLFVLEQMITKYPSYSTADMGMVEYDIYYAFARVLSQFITKLPFISTSSDNLANYPDEPLKVHFGSTVDDTAYGMTMNEQHNVQPVIWAEPTDVIPASALQLQIQMGVPQGVGGESYHYLTMWSNPS